MGIILRDNQDNWISGIRGEFDAGHDGVMGVASTGYWLRPTKSFIHKDLQYYLHR